MDIIIIILSCFCVIVSGFSVDIIKQNHCINYNNDCSFMIIFSPMMSPAELCIISTVSESNKINNTFNGNELTNLVRNSPCSVLVLILLFISSEKWIEKKSRQSFLIGGDTWCTTMLLLIQNVISLFSEMIICAVDITMWKTGIFSFFPFFVRNRRLLLEWKKMMHKSRNRQIVLIHA